MEILICLTTVWIFWFISSKSWRRRLIQPAGVVIITILVVTSPAFSSLLAWGLTARLPTDLGGTADAIVVLGRGPILRPERTAIVLQLWRAKRASHIFASGMMDANSIVEYLQQNGVPTSAMEGEECSQSTEENALFSSALLQPEGVHDILLVTDLLHMQRSLLVFRSVGFNVIPHAVTIDSQTLSKTQWLSMAAREYLGLLLYALNGKFQKRSSGNLPPHSPEVLRKISDWNCRVLKSKPLS